ncbi:MAG TPA: diguanylate cyclase [Burkholderiaceae bacterium]|nr:diguanylate cyclase [Burkholderiaceae bacterium]
MAFEAATREELQSILAQLKEALNSHQLWYGALVRTIVCGLPGDKHDVEETAHKECRFGQWFYGEIPESLRCHPGYTAMGQEHLRLHDQARQLLLAARTGNGIATLDYDNFANALDRLRLEITSLERELEHALYNHDGLTGAITRYDILPTLREQQQLAKRSAQGCYIAMMDFDHFKAVNDRYGHPAADQVLAKTIRHLIGQLRPYDKVFRYGGEEFLLCMPGAVAARSLDRIDGLRAQLAALAIDIGTAEPVHITVSFGLAQLDPDLPAETSIERADRALYAAKAAGRNCVRAWEPSMQ